LANVLPISKIKTAKLTGLIVLVGLVTVYAGGLALGFAATVTQALLRVLEFIGVVGIPVAGGVFLLWFAYKLFLDPVIRQRKLDRIRESRAQRAATLRADPTDRTDTHG
jgi:hypothetical protein